MGEFWRKAMTAEIIPLQERLMQGSVSNHHRETLKHRLQGLCDNTETGVETFTDHETVYSLKHNGATFTVNLRRALDHPDLPWSLRYMGVPDQSKDDVLFRSCIESAVSSNISRFLTDMGFSVDYEYVAKGYLFRRGMMKVTISTIFKMLQPGNVEQLEQISLSHLVELSVLTSASAKEQIDQDMKTFAEQLKPLIQLEKIDTRKLQQQL